MGIGKWEQILEEIPNIKEDKKRKLKMDATTSLLNDDKELEKKQKL